MEANRHGRYHHRQPPEKQINFFFFFLLHFYPQFSMMASFPEMMYRLIGVDASCQSNIRGIENWQWIWWGNPHAYISADKGAGTTSPRPSILLHFCLSCLPLEIPPSRLTRRPFMFLVFHAAVTPASLLLLQLLPHIRSTGRGEAGMPTHPSAVWPWRSSTGAAEDLITLFTGI